MKTSKELSQEIMKKIKNRDEARLQFRKHARRWFAFASIFGFLIPTSVIFVTNECFSREPQFTLPLVEERPFDPDEFPDSERDNAEPSNPYEVIFTV